MKKPSSPSRRKFLRNLAVTTVAATVLPQGKLFGASARPSRKALRAQLKRNWTQRRPVIWPISRTRFQEKSATYWPLLNNPGQVQ